MLGKYRDVYEPVDALCGRLGLQMVRDEDFLRQYLRASDGLGFSLEGSMTTEAISFFIEWPGTPRGGHAVWLLMEAFGERVPPERRAAKPDDQVWFVETHLDTLMFDEASYRPEYDRLNTLPIDWLSL